MKRRRSSLKSILICSVSFLSVGSSSFSMGQNWQLTFSVSSSLFVLLLIDAINMNIIYEAVDWKQRSDFGDGPSEAIHTVSQSYKKIVFCRGCRVGVPSIGVQIFLTHD